VPCEFVICSAESPLTYGMANNERGSADMNFDRMARRPRYLTVRKAAGTLGVSQSTIHRAIRLGLLQASRRHGVLVVSDADVLRLLGGAR
jgi:hypothetical protein